MENNINTQQIKPIKAETKEVLGVTGLILGAIGLTSCCVLVNAPMALLAVIFGIQGLDKGKKATRLIQLQDYEQARFLVQQAAARNKAALILGIIGMVITLAIYLFIALAPLLGWVSIVDWIYERFNFYDKFYNDFFEKLVTQV